MEWFVVGFGIVAVFFFVMTIMQRERQHQLELAMIRQQAENVALNYMLRRMGNGGRSLNTNMRALPGMDLMTEDDDLPPSRPAQRSSFFEQLAGAIFILLLISAALSIGGFVH